MKDRIPTVPGRVLIHPEDGKPDFYAILSMADDPSQLGTDLNKLNLLTDLTVSKLGLPASPEPTVDLALKRLAYKSDVITGSYTGSGGSSRKISLGVKPKAVFVCDSIGRTYDRVYNAGSTYIYSGGLVTYGSTLTVDGEAEMKILSIDDTGFNVYTSYKRSEGMWEKSVETNKGVHYYVAFY